ncbi:hypothetical protein [Methanobrevibacter sp.]|uniref:hypothetical protein n=1 Tax=Methanobrevibacter sp. TaxID=66852 RepID=UPI002E78EA22|nr:hypothetical protein [Methanobrevibacter sp.]MEE1336691.1 hypothetical protein [Methanobrevibacter sp.]
MLNKKWMVLAIFFISLVAISGVSAAEDAGDVAAIESDTQTDVITTDTATDELQGDALKASADDESDDALTASNDEEILTGGSNCYVNSSYTGSQETGIPDQPYKSLDKALNAEGRKDGDIIFIAAGNGYSGSYDIKNNLTFTNWGPGEVVFDANGEGRIFNVLAREINITGITFKNAMNEMGGAIIFENGLVNSHIDGSFINNHAGTGGAICILGTIENSLISAYFENNTALTGGAIYAENITHTEINGDFFNNAAILMESLGSDFPIGVGGAIATVFIEDSLIEGDFRFNRAGNLGGAIFVLESMDRSNITGGFMHNSALVGGAANIFTIRNSKIKASFENNTALIGGAINVNIINSTEIDSYFINNTADLNLMDLVDDATKEEIEYYLEKYVDSKILEYIVNYTVAHGINLGFGGGIAVDGIVLNSNITGEFTRNGGADAGGAISVLGVVDGSLISGSFMLNHAGLGGSLFLPVVKNSYIGGGFQSNYAVQGGAIFAVFANHTDICGNFAENDALNNIDLIGADLLAWGGAICIDGVLENSNINGTFYKNRATELGGAIGGVDFAVNSNITGYFIENGAKIGGAMDLPFLKYSNIDGFFVNNTAVIGGAISACYVNESQINAHFVNNTVVNYQMGDVIAPDMIEYNDHALPVGLGGAICIAGAAENSMFTGDYVLNSALAGGAIFVYGMEIPRLKMVRPFNNNAIYSHFVYNGAYEGGAILINATSIENEINSNFISNNAMDEGIVSFYRESINDTISHCLFMNNQAKSIIFVESADGTNITRNILLNAIRAYDIYHSSGSKLNANDNWFGHNATNYKEFPLINGTAECSTWLFLNATAKPNPVQYLGSSDIVFDLFRYNVAGSIEKYDTFILEPVALGIASTNGNVDKNISTFGDIIKFSSNGKKGIIIASLANAQYSVEIKCVPRMSANDLVMDYLGANYRIQVFDEDGNPAMGETVKITVNGKTYVEKTDKDGYATLPIRLKPKTYAITSTFNGNTVTKTLKVKNTLKVKKSFTVKKTAKKLVIKATLKWSNGKAIAGKKVSFKFKGKIFTVKTNKNGLAKITFSVKNLNNFVKLTFKQKVVKLNLGKTYKMMVSYKNETASSKLLVKK